jgi:putative membrane protein
MERTVRWIGIGGVALLAAVVGSTVAGGATKHTRTATAPSFVREAAAGGLMEVELGKIAEERASANDVKEFARRMVADHTKANDELKDLASRKKVAVPSDLDAKQKAQVDRLSKLSGHTFDESYMKAMTADHVHDVAAFRRAAASSADADVKDFASRTLPTLEDHLTEARRVEAEVTHASGPKSGA